MYYVWSPELRSRLDLRYYILIAAYLCIDNNILMLREEVSQRQPTTNW